MEDVMAIATKTQDSIVLPFQWVTQRIACSEKFCWQQMDKHIEAKQANQVQL